MTDRIEKQIEIAAPVARVWRALTDYKEFGEWFLVKLDGPIVAGEPIQGQITHPGYEHVRFMALCVKVEPQRLFSFSWNPYAIDQTKDYSHETPTLVEFTLEPTAKGTLLKVVESGFDKVPADRRDLAFRMNDGGWAQQMKNIEAYVARKA